MPFVKSSGTILRAVSTTAAHIEEYAQKGEQHLLKAREIAAKNTTGTFASASELDTKQEIKLTIQEPRLFVYRTSIMIVPKPMVKLPHCMPKQ